MASKNSDNLIDDIIRFINTEREVYGEFDVSSKRALNPTTSSEKVPEDSRKSAQSSAAQSSSNTDMESQEKLFDGDKNREIYYEIKKCSTLDELKVLCSRTDVLKTDLEGTNLVFGVGNPDADLMLIGEAPGADEDRHGEPFVGKAGKLLNKILSAINFKREDVYIANILKHRPPNNRNPKPEERERSLPFLLRQIDLINPKLILCLGKVAAQTLLDNDNSLVSMRGKFHDFRGKYELMATYHPAALLRHSQWKRPTWEDVQMLRERYDELGCEP